jgi:phosphatidylglycerol:prolipoprotein diacylglycerol transferase
VHLPILAELAFPGWDPVALHLGPLAIRWYGLGYLAGFLLAGLALDKLGRDGFIALSKASVSDLIGWLVLGVLVGGRLGYAVFYDQRLLIHPLELARIWEGGLSFHGGLAGVVVASGLFARRRGLPWRRLADALALAVPAGIALVRCANFVNAELYGRVAPAWLPWAVRFPTDPVARILSPELARAGSLRWHDGYAALRASGRWAEIAPQLPLRHPAQLYEALLEGLLLGALLWLLYARRGRVTARPGALAATFLAGYAAARFLVEFTRQPDPQLGLVVGPLSMGQVLSTAVAAGAAALLFRPRTHGATGASEHAPKGL